jgi:hypothetical protein
VRTWASDRGPMAWSTFLESADDSACIGQDDHYLSEAAAPAFIPAPPSVAFVCTLPRAEACLMPIAHGCSRAQLLNWTCVAPSTPHGSVLMTICGVTVRR